MTFIDFFSGVGGFTRGLELAGHKDTNVIGGMSKDNSKYIELVIYENPINDIVFSDSQLDWEEDDDDTET